MESSNILNRMASYDFKAPIDIVCFEEENSNDQIDLTSSPDANEVMLNKEINENNGVEAQISKTLAEKQVPTKNNKRKQKSSNGRTNENQKRKKGSEKSSPRKDQYEINQEYINDDLKTVSKYLTLIMESYSYYLYVLKKGNSTFYDISLSKKSFLSTKYHFFNAAYNYVISYIVPNENNQSFTQIFLNYVSNMASERIKTDCHLGIREMYFEMIQWAKSKQYQKVNDSNNTPILRRHLNDAPIISTTKSLETVMEVQQPSSTNVDQLCIFSSGPHGSQISINIDKSLITNKNQLTNHPSDKSVVLEQTQVIQQHNELPINGNLSLNNNFPQNTYENRLIYRESESRIPLYQPSQNLKRNVANENNQVCHNAYFNYYHTTNNYQQRNNFNYAVNSVMHGTAQMPQNNTINQDITLRTFRKDYHDVPRQEIGRPLPPPYCSPITEYPNQTARVAQAPVVQTDFSSNADLTRSSVSTDSGFVSPVGSKGGNNTIEDIMNELLELESIVQPTKPDATITCYVCHKKSTLMCSACYKTNYCSPKCQRVDWDTHRAICQRSQ